jgi:hypothetical protein
MDNAALGAWERTAQLSRRLDAREIGSQHLYGGWPKVLTPEASNASFWRRIGGTSASP